MKIETKFEVDQEVFYMEDSKVKKEKIWKMDVEIYRSGVVTYTSFYRVGNNVSPYCINQNLVFATKEELINSL